jgi:hypothetical protein
VLTIAEIAWRHNPELVLEPTAGTGVDAGGGLLIDYLVNDTMAGHVDPTSYRVHPSTASDHRLVTAARNLRPHPPAPHRAGRGGGGALPQQRRRGRCAPGRPQSSAGPGPVRLSPAQKDIPPVPHYPSPDQDRNPTPRGLDVAHSARVWNYWLGGKDHFAADRQLGDRISSSSPTSPTSPAPAGSSSPAPCGTWPSRRESASSWISVPVCPPRTTPTRSPNGSTRPPLITLWVRIF